MLKKELMRLGNDTLRLALHRGHNVYLFNCGALKDLKFVRIEVIHHYLIQICSCLSSFLI